MSADSLTDELDSEQQMMAELEEAFKHRYTDEDEEYKATISKPVPPPPAIVPWTGRPKRNYDWSRDRSGDRSGWNRRGGYRDYGYQNRGGGRRNYQHDNSYGSHGSRYQDHYQPVFYPGQHRDDRRDDRRDNRRDDRRDNRRDGRRDDRYNPYGRY